MKKRIDHTKLIPEQKNHVLSDHKDDLQEAIERTKALQTSLIALQHLHKMGAIKDDKAALQILQPYVDQCEGDVALMQAKIDLLRPTNRVKYPLWVRVAYAIMKLLGRTK
jgi:hypothetical protein